MIPNQQSLILIFGVASLIYFLFSIWYEGKRDGFDTEKTFDTFFLATLTTGLLTFGLAKYLSWASIYAYKSPLLLMERNLELQLFFYIVSSLLLFLYSLKIKWSYFKILDLYALSLSQSFSIFSVGLYFSNKNIIFIMIPLTLLLINKFFFSFRNYKFSSGIVYISTSYLYGTYVLFEKQVAGHLLAAFILVTISSVILYLRIKEGNMKASLPSDLLEHLKNKLINKDNELKKQEKLLKEEDPYMQPGRAEDNSESMDEAILEDSRKELTDANKSFISGMRIQVKKALAYIKLGRYGVCEVCGNPIDKARLQIYPEATKCAECAAKNQL